MKYVFMFVSRPDFDATGDPAEQKEVYGRIFEWFQEHGGAGRISEQGAELHPVETATTVRTQDDGGVVVVDGPYSEAKEVIGGFTVVDVPDLDAAIGMARTWPAMGVPGVSIEIRPMVTDYSQFD